MQVVQADRISSLLDRISSLLEPSLTAVEQSPPALGAGLERAAGVAQCSTNVRVEGAGIINFARLGTASACFCAESAADLVVMRAVRNVGLAFTEIGHTASTDTVFVLCECRGQQLRGCDDKADRNWRHCVVSL